MNGKIMQRVIGILLTIGALEAGMPEKVWPQPSDPARDRFSQGVALDRATRAQDVIRIAAQAAPSLSSSALLPQGETVSFGPILLTLPAGWQRREDSTADQPQYEAAGAALGHGATILLAAEEEGPAGAPGTQGVDILSTRIVTIGGNKAKIETWHHTATDMSGQTISFPELTEGKVIRIIAWMPRPLWPAWKPELRSILSSVSMVGNKAVPQQESSQETMDHPPVSAPHTEWRVWEFGAAAVATPSNLTILSNELPLTYQKEWEVVLLEKPDAPESGLFLRMMWSGTPAAYSADLEVGSILSTKPSELGGLHAMETEFRLVNAFNNTRGIDLVTEEAVRGGYLTFTCRMPSKRWRKASHLCTQIVSSFVVGR